MMRTADSMPMAAGCNGVKLVMGECRAEECEGITVFGASYWREGKELEAHPDLSHLREHVEHLVGLCNQYGVSRYNFLDVVEDFLD